MKRAALAACLSGGLVAAVLLTAPTSAEARPPRVFGAGFILGEPTGLSAKLFLARQHALQSHLGFAFAKRNRISTTLDYLFHLHDVIPPFGRAGNLSPYFGVGGILSFRTHNKNSDARDANIGLRFPVGASFALRAVPIEIYLEVAPGVSFINEAFFTVDGGTGARYYF